MNHISKGIKRVIDLIIIALRIQFPACIGWSRYHKYKKIVENKKKAGKPCDIIHIVKLDDDRESAFLIQDMFPITDEYIEREYTIAGNHLMLTSEHTVKEIEQKARKVMGMLKRGVKFTPTQPDVMKIIEKLTEK